MTTTLASTVKPRAEDSFAISFAPLSLEEIYAKSDDPANGAVVLMDVCKLEKLAF
jgi:molybdopterin synthase catalytic subunit